MYVPNFFTILKSKFALTYTPFVHLSPNNQDFAGSHEGKYCWIHSANEIVQTIAKIHVCTNFEDNL